MGCASSSIKDVDALPVRPHYRTAFARTSTNDRASGTVDGPGGTVPLAVVDAFKPPPGATVGGGAVAALVTGTASGAAAAAELADCHDIVLCYTLSGETCGYVRPGGFACMWGFRLTATRHVMRAARCLVLGIVQPAEALHSHGLQAAKLRA
mgnify:CR=1 FL=1